MKHLKYSIFTVVIVVLAAAGYYFLTAKDFRLVVMTSTVDEASRAVILGANVNKVDEFGRTPIMYAVGFKCSDYKADLIRSLGGKVQKVEANARHSPLAIAKFLLEKGVNVNVQDKSGDTPLYMVIRNNLSALVSLLIQYGADVDQAYDQGETPLSLAAYGGNPEIVGLLISAGAKVNVKDHAGNTPLITAFLDPNLDVVEKLLGAGANVNTANADGETPLILAIQEDDLAFVKVMVKAGADVNAVNFDGDTPLLWACMEDRYNAVDMLINAGAKVDVKNNDGDTPISLAMNSERSVEMLRLLTAKMTVISDKELLVRAIQADKFEEAMVLIQADADVNYADPESGYTPLMEDVSAEGNTDALIQALVKAGANVNAQDKQGQTALLMACFTDGKRDVAKLLLKNGADPNIKSLDGDLPLQMAILAKDADLLKALLDSGADPNLTFFKGCTALTLALGIGEETSMPIVKVLLKAGAKLELRNSDGETALLAALNANAPLSIVKLLIDEKADVNAQFPTNDTVFPGYTPLMMAIADKDAKEVINLLLKAGADVTIKDRKGKTVLDHARKEGLSALGPILEAARKKRTQ